MAHSYEYVPVGTTGGGVVIQSENDTQAGGWDVPELTPAQVATAHNALVAGSHCSIVNASGEVIFTAYLADNSTGRPAITIEYYWLGFVDYQVTAQDTVAITAHEIEAPEGMIVQSNSYITLSDALHTAVPALTETQFSAIYSALANGETVYIRDYVGTNYTLVRQRAEVSGSDTIYLTYLDRLELVYTLDNNTVTVTFKEIGGSGSGEDENAVHYTAETKTSAQKAQARENIGAAAASDIPTVPITSISIDGTAITPVAKDVAIPTASASQKGVAKTAIANGTQMVNGAIATVEASRAEINAKSQGYKVITPENLDYAVQQALVNTTETWDADDAGALRDLSDAEYVGNKTTTLNSSSTNAQYPSAKATYEAIEDVREIAAGKGASIVVSAVTVPAFASENVTITISGTFTDVQGQSHTVSSLKPGDNIYVTQDNYPDRWVLSVVSGVATLHILSMQEAPVEDVTVAGTSVVSNKTAVIPRAGEQAFGVVKTGVKGVRIDANGVLYVETANNTEIDEKYDEYAAITPPHLDYAVRAGLGRYDLGDDDENAWSTTEKAHAREVIGAGDIHAVSASLSDAYPTLVDASGDEILPRTKTGAISDANGVLLETIIAAKYTKPSSGIPKTDLASAVQTSLGKADTALQSIPGVEIHKLTNATSSSGTWVATSTDISAYADGLLVLLKTPAAGASTTTLNINSLGAKTIYRFGATKLTTQYLAGSALLLAYSTENSGCFFVVNDYSATNTNTVPAGDCATTGASQSKNATHTKFVLRANSYELMTIYNANSYNGKITLNINSTGAKDIWINGAVSSSTNKTLPAGTYIIYYDGSVYHFRTDGKIPFVDTISGTAAGGNWKTLTINGVTNAIPEGGGGGGTTIYRHTVKFQDADSFYHTVSFKSGYANAFTDITEFRDDTKFSENNLEYYWVSNSQYGFGSETYYFTSIFSVEYSHGYLDLWRCFGYTLDDSTEDMDPTCQYLNEYELSSTACTDTVTEAY